MAGLSKQLFVSVESQTQGFQSTSGEHLFEQHTRSHSQLPLLGVEQECRLEGSSQRYHCQGWLDPLQAEAPYRSQIKQLEHDLSEGLRSLANELSDAQLLHLQQLLTTQQRLNRLRTVLLALNPNVKFSPSDTGAEIAARLAAYGDRHPSLARAAMALAQAMDKANNILVTPPLPSMSQQITPFSRRFQHQLTTALGDRATGDPAQARLKLSGAYQEVGEGLDLLYTLTEVATGKVILATSVLLLPSAYRGLEHKPSSLDLDQLLFAGYLDTPELKADLQTNKGSRALSFVDGETVQVMAKLNRSGYFYLVGHSQNGNDRYSYLLELSDEPGPYRFMYYIGPGSVNKWVLLGEFAVDAPYGYEMLQMIASNHSLEHALPNTRYDGKSGYHRLLQEGGIGATRGLKRRQAEQPQVLTAEAVLSFTSAANF
ncbi:hypothetical protein GCM10023333_34200 [Ferrimonas pelagia]|uniref:Uncharacterized protein n=1 Tax=Ferrimonas pelagia TaxID=1177826 RepID=A0ABP9FBS2_9GAMM